MTGFREITGEIELACPTVESAIEAAWPSQRPSGHRCHLAQGLPRTYDAHSRHAATGAKRERHHRENLTHPEQITTSASRHRGAKVVVFVSFEETGSEQVFLSERA